MDKLLVFLLLASSALGQEYNPVVNERAPESIQRLPAGVRQDLVRRKCLIPKYKGDIDDGDSAFSMGHFRSGTSIDYAVVCHIPPLKIQDVLVYWNSKATWHEEVIDQEEFDPSPHAGKCEATVDVATPQYIVDHANAYAPEELKSLPPLDHNGVNVEYCEKASIVFYFSEDKWLQLQGAD